MLEEALMNRYVAICMDTMYVLLSTLTSLIYVYRTYDMCLFDTEPVWKFYEEPEKYNAECKGEFSRMYYIILLVSHSFFVIEFILRTIVQKYQLKFIMTFESFFEIFTTIPFFICWISFGTNSNSFQFFIMIDQMKLLLLGRFTRNIESEISREVVLIAMNIFFIGWVAAAFTQFIENEHEYS